MELLQLRYFRDAARLENFSKTAQKNMVPQPSISKTISKLEKELGVSLFHRKGKQISLNKNGRFFYNKVNEALTCLDEGISHFTSPIQANIRIYIQAGNRYVSMLTADFLTSTKDIFVSIINTVSNDSSTDYDFTFMQKLKDMSAYNFEHLMDDEIVLVVSKNNPLSKLKIVGIKDLSDETFVGYYQTMNLRNFTDSYCNDVGGFKPIVSFETHDASALRYMIEKDKGIALMPEKFFLLQPSDKLQIVHIKEKAFRSLIIAWDKNKNLSPQAIKFKEFTKKWFKSM